MAKKIYEESNISAIAESIRAKTGTDTKYKTSEMPSGVNEVYESGKQDVISKSKYIPKTASGKGVFLNDVSEVAHKVKVYADTPTEVTVCGKNLFNNDTSLLKEVTFCGSSGNPATRIGYEPLVLPSGTYTFTLKDLGTVTDKYIYGAINDKDGNFLRGCSLLQDTKNSTPLTITINEGDKVYIYDGNSTLSMSHSVNRFNSVDIQLEVGSNTTEYEPYKGQTITATLNGIEVSSICPTMNFFTDDDITVDYYGSYGMQTEWDRFWTAFQQKGARTNYSHAFKEQFPQEVFKPKYDFKPTNAEQMFYYNNFDNLEAILSDCGVVLDTSNATSSPYMFGYSTITHIPIIDLSKCTHAVYMFANFGNTSTSYYRNRLVSIRKIISSKTTVFANNTFSGCYHLEHCVFEGTIASDINLQWSTKLSVESLASLFNCLKNFRDSDPDNVNTKTITLSAESWALLDTYVYENGWNDYGGAKDVVGAYLGWNYA